MFTAFYSINVEDKCSGVLCVYSMQENPEIPEMREGEESVGEAGMCGDGLEWAGMGGRERGARNYNIPLSSSYEHESHESI